MFSRSDPPPWGYDACGCLTSTHRSAVGRQVRKSTLLNALTGRDAIVHASLRSDGRATHYDARELFRLPNSAVTHTGLRELQCGAMKLASMRRSRRCRARRAGAACGLQPRVEQSAPFAQLEHGTWPRRLAHGGSSCGAAYLHAARRLARLTGSVKRQSLVAPCGSPVEISLG